ncbi:hypothetical protein UPYG_G00349180 [Umbra pygmaea]|uniref:Uncharacterized protein n=1 Tax=Umbra pygmaea TaxID=75934 RepID=A0ABD0VYS2_UMBPY
MLHLSTDVVCFKGLDSAFMFENYLQTIRKMVRSGKSSLAQVANRLPTKKQASKTRKDQAYHLEDGQCCEVVNQVDGRKGTNGGVLLLASVQPDNQSMTSVDTQSSIIEFMAGPSTTSSEMSDAAQHLCQTQLPYSNQLHYYKRHKGL